jgi:hypothetical protein
MAAASSGDEWWYDDSPSERESAVPKDKSRNLDPSSAGSTKAGSSPFFKGQELKQLRSDLEYYRENLKWAEAVDDIPRIASLTKEIEEKEQRDPEIVYNKARRLIAEAQTVSRSVLKPDLKEKLIAHWSLQKKLARECLVRFQMEGLWVGK